MSLPYTTPATIKDFTNGSVIIVTDDGQQLTVPKDMVSQNATIGGTVHLAVFSEQDVATEREKFASNILQELLGEK